MFFSLKELVRWFGVTVFEIWMNLAALLIFSILAVLKHEEMITSSWWLVFVPLFTCDGLNAYFCIIVFIRMYKEKDYRSAGLRLLSSLLCLVCFFICKFLFCQKLNNEEVYSHSEVFAPAFIPFVAMMIKACQMH